MGAATSTSGAFYLNPIGPKSVAAFGACGDVVGGCKSGEIKHKLIFSFLIPEIHGDGPTDPNTDYQNEKGQWPENPH